MGLFSKLLFTAAGVAAAAGVVYYIQKQTEKKEAYNVDDFDEDYEAALTPEEEPEVEVTAPEEEEAEAPAAEEAAAPAEAEAAEAPAAEAEVVEKEAEPADEEKKTN